MTQKQEFGSIEKRFRLTWLHDVTTPIFLLDQQGKLSFCNKAFQALTGSTKRHMCGKGFDVFVAPADATRFIRDELRLFRGSSMERVAYDLVNAVNESHYHVELNLNPVFDAKHDKVLFIIGLVLSSEKIS